MSLVSGGGWQGMGWAPGSPPEHLAWGLGVCSAPGLSGTLHTGSGYCRSEAVVVMLLTKKSLARRVYATILNAGTNTDGCKEQGRCQPGVEGPRAGLPRGVIGQGLRPCSSCRCDLPLRGGAGAAHPLPVRASRAGPRVPGVH